MVVTMQNFHAMVNKYTAHFSSEEERYYIQKEYKVPPDSQNKWQLILEATG
jgi:hypothetical protein